MAVVTEREALALLTVGVGDNSVTKVTPFHISGKTTATTAEVIFSPDSDRRFVVTDLILDVTQGGTIHIFEDSDQDGNHIFQGTFESATYQMPFSHSFKTPWVAHIVGHSIKITATGGTTKWVIVGYQV